MNKTFKLWLCGMTGDRLKDITEATSCYDYFDGLVFVDHLSKDGTYELLESRKKDGLIIRRPYYKQHSHSQNEVLYSRHIKNGDWIFWIDSPERIKPLWLENMRSQILDAITANIGAFCFSGRAYLWQYNDGQEFTGSPHWGVKNIYGKFITYGEENKDLYLENTRKEKPEESFCLHPIKYWYVFNPSNEVQIMYGKYGQEVINFHESLRLQFRHYCESVLNLSLESLDDLIKHMENIRDKKVIPESFFVDCVETEFRLSELFQLKVLNQDYLSQIASSHETRYIWSFKNYLQFGDGWHDKNYKGTIHIYDKKLNDTKSSN